ncbi:hypothetical protein [Xenococcus sp. PCC 7305]|nr:hypothetical protein [Xenococcus sp. PCC 7305]
MLAIAENQIESDAWLIAKLNNRLNDAIFAKGKHDNAIAKRIVSDFAEVG